MYGRFSVHMLCVTRQRFISRGTWDTKTALEGDFRTTSDVDQGYRAVSRGTWDRKPTQKGDSRATWDVRRGYRAVSRGT